MIVFEKTDIQLINDLWAFLSTCGDGYAFDDALMMESKKALAGWLVYESEGHLELWSELNMFERAYFIAKGVEKYGV